MASGEEKFSVDKLNSKNYSTWKFKLTHYLIAKDLWGVVDGSETEPTEATVKAQYEKKLKQAMSLIVFSVSDNLMYLITTCKSPKEAWDILQGHFERNTLTNRLFLKKQYFRAVMPEGASVEQHIRYMKEQTDKLAAVDDVMTEENQIVALLGSLPDSFSPLVTALEASRGTLTLSYVQQALISDEQRRSSQPATSGAGGGKPDAAYYAGKKKFNRNKSRNCFECGSPNHMKRDCPKLKSAHKESSGQRHNAKHAAEETGADDYGFIISGTDEINKKDKWLIDSGATSHMTFNRDMFSDYKLFEKPQQVCLGDGHVLEAVGVGNVEIVTAVSRIKSNANTMHDVLHVPAMKVNLFSVRAAASRGVVVQFGHSRCWLKNKQGKLKATGTLTGKLYFLDTCSDVHKASVACDLWHKRLGHASVQVIKSAQNLVEGADLSQVTVTDTCEPCIKGKMARKPFSGESKSHKQTTRPLELIHSDVCGPMQNKSIGGSFYFVTFIDDFSRYAFVYFMREKSEVFARFKEFEALVTNQTGLSIAQLRSDNGGEYIGRDFEQYLSGRGIHHQLTVRYTPEQNGVAERYNRTIVESARAMILEAGLPKRFWTEAVAVASYTRNRLPTKAREGTTPYELYHKRKPNLSHMRVFGAAAYSHIPAQLRRKLDGKAERMVFIGYGRRSMGYRLYDPYSGLVVTRRDVIFDESKLGLPPMSTNGSAESCDLDMTFSGPDTQSSGRTNDSSNNQNQSVSDGEQSGSRSRQPPVRFGIDEFITYAGVEHMAMVAGNVVEPETFSQAMKSPDAKQWENAAKAEYDSLLENDTWSLVELPSNRQAIKCKWVFRAKYDSEGNIERYKARVVAKGFEQKHGIDYDETYAPVVKYPSLRALLSYAVSENMLIHQMDVVTAFLNGKLDEEIYMVQPEGFIKPGSENLVCKLNRSLYGLKQAPRMWNAMLDEFLKQNNFCQSHADQCVYVRGNSDEKTIIAVYVDDMVILSKTNAELNRVKQLLAERFKMKDMGELKYILGINVKQGSQCVFLNQQTYVEQMLDKYGMGNCNPASTPAATDLKLIKEDGSKSVDQSQYQSMIGSLLYLAVGTRPDIAFAVGAVSKFNSCPTESHLTAVKRIFRYLKGSSQMGIKYSGSNVLVGYADASWGSDHDDRHSTSGVVFFSANGPISWLSKRQSTVALSTAESEYVALFSSVKEAVWLKQLFEDLGESQSNPIYINCDNMSALAIANNSKSNKNVKHMEIKYHYVRETIESKVVATKYCPTEVMVADILTKPLARARFEALCAMLGLDRP